jgi:hypothetical protein
MAVRVFNYANALVNWERSGRPTRSDEEVERIIRECCKPCSFFRPVSGKDDGEGICGHRLCGCRINHSQHAVINKVRMASESCPIGKWHKEGD